MSKRKNGQEIINVPQPKYPEMAVFEGNVMHSIVPRDLGNGTVEYDISKLPASVATKAEACITQSLVRLPALERDAAIVKKAIK
jgi:hypothetical protein